MDPSIPVPDQALLLIADELSLLIAAFALVYSDELEEQGDTLIEFADDTSTRVIPALLKLAIKQNKGDK